MINRLHPNKNFDRHTYIIDNSQDVSDRLKRLQTKYEKEEISFEKLVGKKTHYMKKPKNLVIRNCSINDRDLKTISEILSTLQTVSFSDCLFRNPNKRKHTSAFLQNSNDQQRNPKKKRTLGPAVGRTRGPVDGGREAPAFGGRKALAFVSRGGPALGGRGAPVVGGRGPGLEYTNSQDEETQDQSSNFNNIDDKLDLHRRSESTNSFKFEKVFLSNLKFETFSDFQKFLEIFFVNTEIKELTFSEQDNNQTKSEQMQLQKKTSKTGKMQKQNGNEQQHQENDIYNDYFFKILEENNHFKNLNKLELQGIHLKDNHAELIANNLYRSNLNYVDLSRNNIGDFGLISFSNNINVISNNLESLILDNNNIGDLGVYNLAYSIRHNKNLELLSLSNNHSLSEEAITLLISTADNPEFRYSYGPYNDKVKINILIDRNQKNKSIRQKTRRLSQKIKIEDVSSDLQLDKRVNTNFQIEPLSKTQIEKLSVSQDGTNVLDTRLLKLSNTWLLKSNMYPDYDENEPRYQDIISVQNDISKLENQIQNVGHESTKELQQYKENTLEVLQKKIERMEELFLKKDNIKQQKQKQQMEELFLKKDNIKQQKQKQQQKTLQKRLQNIKNVLEQNTSTSTSSNEQKSSTSTSSNEQNKWVQNVKLYIKSLQEILGKENEPLKEFRKRLLERKKETLEKIKNLFQDFEAHKNQNTQETNKKQENNRQENKKLEIVKTEEELMSHTFSSITSILEAFRALQNSSALAFPQKFFRPLVLIFRNIDFADIHFGDDYFIFLIEFLHLQLKYHLQKGTGRHLDSLYSIEFNNCNINDTQLYKLLVILGDTYISKGLKSVSLYNNNITDLGASILSSYLVHNSNIEILQLDKNKIESTGAMILARALQINNSLNILSLNNNQITNPGIEDLIQCLHSINISSSENHFPICSISLLGNKIDSNDTLAFLLKQLREKLDEANIFSDIFVINRNNDFQNKHVYEVTVKRIQEGKKTFLLQDEDFIQWAQNNDLGRTYRQNPQQTTSMSVSSTSSSQRRTTQVSNEKFLQYIRTELAQPNKKQKTYRAKQKHAQYVDYFRKQPITIDVNKKGRSTSSKDDMDIEKTEEIYLHKRDPSKFMINNIYKYFQHGYTFPDSGEAFRFDRNNFYSCSNNNNEEKIKTICNKIFQKYVNEEQSMKIQNQMEKIRTIQADFRKQERSPNDRIARDSRSLSRFGIGRAIGLGNRFRVRSAGGGGGGGELPPGLEDGLGRGLPGPGGDGSADGGGLGRGLEGPGGLGRGLPPGGLGRGLPPDGLGRGLEGPGGLGRGLPPGGLGRGLPPGGLGRGLEGPGGLGRGLGGLGRGLRLVGLGGPGGVGRGSSGRGGIGGSGGIGRGGRFGGSAEGRIGGSGGAGRGSESPSHELG